MLQTKNYLKLTAAVLLLFSVVLIILPGFVLRLLNGHPSIVGSLFIQFLGASLIGTAYLNWQAARFDGQALKAVLLMNVVSLSPAVVISAVMMLRNGATYPAAAILIMHLLFLRSFVHIYRKTT